VRLVRRFPEPGFGLADEGFSRVAIAGDSAGGGLALSLAALVRARQTVAPRAVIAISPWTDLTMSGKAVDDRASAYPLRDRSTLIDAAKTYHAGADPADPRASPLFGDVAGLPPIQIHVGDDEVLLDDSVRYASRVTDHRGSIELHVWEGMIHVFTSSIAILEAARHATDMMCDFLDAHLSGAVRTT
jgi:acetyl esterase/lipase